ncbi:MAG: FHA domain-containing protein [Verrucomicrobiota bacterium]|nr:FHA domain-containing protein [Verrucomicrobiota bacterium]
MINGVAHELVESTITIGRLPDNAICIADPSVSGRHAQFLRVGESYHLKDLGSTNGTRVNGGAITTVPLRVGDRVRFGGVEAWFETDVKPEAQALPAPEHSFARPAEQSARPADFANASPFGHRAKAKDRSRAAIVATAALAILAFAGSIIAILSMHAPAL